MRSLIILGLLVSSAAFAAPLRAKNGHTIRLALGDRRERGIALKSTEGRWRLLLREPHGALAAEVVDVTRGAEGDKWLVEVVGGTLVFDAARFVADHAYRVELRRGPRSLGSTVVYLTPPRAAKQRALSFEAVDEAAESDEIATLPKSAL